MPQPFSLCVYCGSRPGVSPAYEAAARALGGAIAERGWRLVYGAGDVGIMGAVADAAITGGANTLGVIPTHLLNREAPDGRETQRTVTQTMPDRHKVMVMKEGDVVEVGEGAQVFDAPQTEYTRTLLAAAFDMKSERVAG